MQTDNFALGLTLRDLYGHITYSDLTDDIEESLKGGNFPNIELVPCETVKISIIADQNRTERERQRLSEFVYDSEDEMPDLSKVVERAKEATGLSDVKRFSTNILRVELSGDNQPPPTMVDLPGLFRAVSQDESVEDADTVGYPVNGYMKKRRSIILAVVFAKSDFALQEVKELARNLDSEVIRTFGLTTKPGTLVLGSDNESSFVRLAQNRDVAFRLGWHVLRNRSYETRNTTSIARDKINRHFWLLQRGLPSHRHLWKPRP